MEFDQSDRVNNLPAMQSTLTEFQRQRKWNALRSTRLYLAPKKFVFREFLAKIESKTEARTKSSDNRSRQTGEAAMI